MSTPSCIAAVVFDLDGTLVDSRRDIVACVEHLLSTHGLPPVAPEVIASYVGDGARRLVARVVGLAVEDPQVTALLAAYLEHYAAHGFQQTTLLPGVSPTLDALDALGLPLALCTHKPRRTTEPLLRALDLERRFRVVIAGEDVPRHKPDPLPLFVIAERLGVPPRRLAMVGDGPQDVLAARAAGALAIGIPGCFLPREALLAAEPELVLETMAELPTLLASRCGAHATS